MSPESEQIPFYIPDVGEAEIEELIETIRSTWVTSGPKVSAFESAFSEQIGAEAALALHSCTAGLHLALVAHGIGPGDEVILPTMTFCSTANVVVHSGATPVLVDVEPDYLTLDIAAVEAAITEQTKAVIVVHYAGVPADLGALRSLCQAHNLLLIEDAAHAFPTTYNGEPIGSGGNPAAFSFYSTKNITTGEGGMLCGSRDFIEKARTLSLHGLSKGAWKRYQAGGDWRYDVEQPGFKYNMTELQAALGMAQLKKLDAMQERRAEITRAYNRAFFNLAGVRIPAERPGCASSYHLYVLRLDPDVAAVNRDDLIAHLKEHGIGTSVHFIPVHQFSYYQDLDHVAGLSFPVADTAFSQILSLPIYPALANDQVGYVARSVFEKLKQ